MTGKSPVVAGNILLIELPFNDELNIHCNNYIHPKKYPVIASCFYGLFYSRFISYMNDKVPGKRWQVKYAEGLSKSGEGFAPHSPLTLYTDSVIWLGLARSLRSLMIPVGLFALRIFPSYGGVIQLKRCPQFLLIIFYFIRFYKASLYIAPKIKNAPTGASFQL